MTTSAPVPFEDETTDDVIDTMPEIVGAFVREKFEPVRTRFVPAVYVVSNEPLEYIDEPYMLPEMPKPPVTTNDPVVLLIETVVLTIDTVPEKVGVFETEKDVPVRTMLVPAVYVVSKEPLEYIDEPYMLPEIPKPPVTTNDPVVLLVETAVLTIDTIPEKVGAFITENVDPDKTRLVPAVYVVNKEPLEYIDDP